MIFVDLQVLKEEFIVTCFEKNSHGHTFGLNKAISHAFSSSRYIFVLLDFQFLFDCLYIAILLLRQAPTGG